MRLNDKKWEGSQQHVIELLRKKAAEQQANVDELFALWKKNSLEKSSALTVGKMKSEEKNMSELLATHKAAYESFKKRHHAGRASVESYRSNSGASALYSWS